MLPTVPLKHLIRIGVDAYVGGIAKVHVRQIAFVNVAQDPDRRQVRNREQVCA